MNRRLIIALSVLCTTAACHMPSGQGQQQQAKQAQPPAQCTTLSESDACRQLASARLALYDKPDEYPLSEKERHDAYVSLYTECMSGHDRAMDSQPQVNAAYAALSPAAGQPQQTYPTGYTVIENNQNVPGKPNGPSTYTTGANGASTVVVVQSPSAGTSSPTVIYASPNGVQTQPSADDDGQRHKHAREPMLQTVIVQPQPQPMQPQQPLQPMTQTVVIPQSQITPGSAPPPPIPAPMAQTVVIPQAKMPAPEPLPQPQPMSQTVVVPQPQLQPAVPAQPQPMTQTVVVPQQPVPHIPTDALPAPMTQNVVVPQPAPPIAPADATPEPMTQTVVVPQSSAAQAQPPQPAPMTQAVVIPNAAGNLADIAPAAGGNASQGDNRQLEQILTQ